MIPKIVHYCWFGRGPKPKLAEKCIASWRKYLPEYEIKEWNEDNFDVHTIPYVAEAYAAKKYAFVSDYARFLVIYKYGGVYFDTDVEIIRPLDDILLAGPFMGMEETPDFQKIPRGLIFDTTGLRFGVNPGLGLGDVQGATFYHDILDLYRQLHFKNPDGTLNCTTVVQHVTKFLCYHRGYGWRMVCVCVRV